MILSPTLITETDRHRVTSPSPMRRYWSRRGLMRPHWGSAWPAESRRTKVASATPSMMLTATARAQPLALQAESVLR